jgi:hypothetical protein
MSSWLSTHAISVTLLCELGALAPEDMTSPGPDPVAFGCGMEVRTMEALAHRPITFVLNLLDGSKSSLTPLGGNQGMTTPISFRHDALLFSDE